MFSNRRTNHFSLQRNVLIESLLLGSLGSSHVGIGGNDHAKPSGESRKSSTAHECTSDTQAWLSRQPNDTATEKERTSLLLFSIKHTHAHTTARQSYHVIVLTI